MNTLINNLFDKIASTWWGAPLFVISFIILFVILVKLAGDNNGENHKS